MRTGCWASSSDRPPQPCSPPSSSALWAAHTNMNPISKLKFCSLYLPRLTGFHCRGHAFTVSIFKSVLLFFFHCQCCIHLWRKWRWNFITWHDDTAGRESFGSARCLNHTNMQIVSPRIRDITLPGGLHRRTEEGKKGKDKESTDI